MNQGYTSRLITTGKHFVNKNDTINWFKQLREAGTSMIILRLRNMDILDLPYYNVKSYLAACALVGQRPYIRFDLSGEVTEEVYNLLRHVEEDVFHNDLFFFKDRILKEYTTKEFNFYNLHPKNFRVVIDSDGKIKLRKHNTNETIEINIGDLNNNTLNNVVDPYKLFYIMENIR